jgi:hypothetical protein
MFGVSFYQRLYNKTEKNGSLKKAIAGGSIISLTVWPLEFGDRRQRR